MTLASAATDPSRALKLGLAVLQAVVVTAVGYLFSALFLSLGLVSFGATSTTGLYDQPVAYTLVTAAGILGFLVVAVGYLGVRRDWSIIHVKRLDLLDGVAVVAGVPLLFLAGLVSTGVVAAIAWATGWPSTTALNGVLAAGQASPVILLLMIPVTVFLVAPGEELLFRGIVQGYVREAVGPYGAVPIAALLFGLPHALATASGEAWTYVISASILGIALGALYEYRENILVPIAVHALWNAALFTLNWARFAGHLPTPA